MKKADPLMNLSPWPLSFSSVPVLSKKRFPPLQLSTSGLLLLFALVVWPQSVFATPPSTTTTLAVTAAGSPITSYAQGTVVTLTATVSSGSTPVNPGTVNFCDATALSCTDIHLIGTAQLTSSGVATVRFRPGVGTHSYKAVFTGTNTYASSSSAVSSLAMLKSVQMSLTTSGTVGSYGLSDTVVVPNGVAPTGTVTFQDITNGNYVLGSAALNLQSSAPAFNSTATVDMGAGNLLISKVVSADLNADGIPDLVVPYGNVPVYLGNGDGTFAATPLTTGNVNATGGICVGDFNSDGKLDLAVANQNNNTVTILLGNGDGTFTLTATALTVGSEPSRVATGDFNGDGNLDLAVTNSSDNTISVFLGRGDGTFAPAPPITTPQAPLDILSGDFNGDGKPDLVITNTNYGSGCVNLFLGNGDGTFTPPLYGISLSGSSHSCFSAVAADLNNDGKLDLVAADYDTRSVWVLLGTGSGSFSGSGFYELGLSPNSLPASVAVGDVNGDGIADLAVACNTGTGLTIETGRGDGSFDAFPFSGSSPFSGVTLADFHGNGLSDVAAMAGSSTTIYTSSVIDTYAASLSPVSPVGSGAHQVQAVYVGDSTYSSATSNTVSLTAQDVATSTLITVSPSTGSNYGQQVVLSAAVTPSTAQGHTTDGELISFTANGTVLGTATLSGGVASLNVTSLPAGVENLEAAYGGDANFAASTSAGASYDVTYPTSLVLTANPSSMSYGQAGSLTATLSPAKTSSQTTDGEYVTFYNGPTILGTGSLSSGVATFILPKIPVSTAVLTASFAGDRYFSAATSSAVSLTVSQATPTVVWSPPASSTPYTGMPIGSALFNASGNAPGAITYSAKAASGSVFAVNSGTVFAAGNYTLTATLTPTDIINYADGSVSVPFTVTPARLTVVPQNASRAYGTVNPGLAGSVSGALNGDTFTVTAATLATITSPVGQYPITYTVTGSNLANYIVTSAEGALTISQAGSATTFAFSNSNLTFTATVASLTSGTPTGSVGFYEGQTMVGTGTLDNGVATFTTSSLPAGTATVSAQYSGDVNFTSSSSSPIQVLSLTPAQTQLTVSSSGSTSETLTLAAAAGFSGTLQLSCIGLPQDATCTFQPASVAFNGTSNNATTTLSIETGIHANAEFPRLFGIDRRVTTLAGIFWLPTLLLAGFARRARKLRSQSGVLMIVLLLGGLCTLVTGCGGSSPSTPSNPTTPIGTSNIQVVATGPAGFTESTTINLTVQ